MKKSQVEKWLLFRWEDVFEVWHKNSSPFTIISRLAKLKLMEKPNVQLGLNFVDTTTKRIYQKKTYYLSYWYIMNELRTPSKNYGRSTWRNIQMNLLVKELSALMPFYVMFHQY